MNAHITDTLTAGAGLCHEPAVKFAVEQGPRAIQWLQEHGVSFSSSKDKQDETLEALHLTREGGHSHRRIIHAADATGLAISNSLINQVQDRQNVTGFPFRTAVDIITQGTESKYSVGAYVYNQTTDKVETFRSRCIVIATGGASKAYLYTSNPDIATGDGIAMCWRAGCDVANMEFNQFHPTCLYHPKAPAFLISEALRGEGGILRLPNGERFMHNFHEKAELAPRDIVARAIDHEMKRLGADHLWLDISHRPESFIKSHFPTIYEKCQSLGINIVKEPIPVVPAAHYTCGGVVTNLHGQTGIERLYAIGETAFTGLHGANRMASNSLLECLAFAFSASDHINQTIDQWDQHLDIPRWDESQVTNSDEDVVISHNWDELRRFMWDYVGIVRTNKRLERAKHRIELLKQEIQEYYSNYRVSNDLIELRNLVIVSELIIRSAMQRKESRGLHFTLDYPGLAKKAEDTILSQDG